MKRLSHRARNGFRDPSDKRPKTALCGFVDWQRPRLAVLNPAKARRFEAFAPGSETLGTEWNAVVGPGVVPRPCDFNYLQCQTSLTALIGAKSIFLDCQTGAVTKPN